MGESLQQEKTDARKISELGEEVIVMEMFEFMISLKLFFNFYFFLRTILIRFYETNVFLRDTTIR